MHRLIFTPKKDKKATVSTDNNGAPSSSDGTEPVDKLDDPDYMFETSTSPMKLFTNDNQKVSALKKRLKKDLQNLPTINDTHIQFAARSRFSDGDEDRAYRLVGLIDDSISGVLLPYDPDVNMLGAVNRYNVTCWLDSLLFSMYARLDSFDSMLRQKLRGPKNRLIIFLRLWVNILRSGHLVTTDITEQIQESLKRCGWKEAADVCQHDVSEAFSFITGVLNLPLITMEMELYHSGKEDQDDHKIISERLLEVAVPQFDDNQPITLEDCLEEHFNTRVEVMRRMEGRDAFSSKGPLSPLSEYGSDEKVPIAEYVESVSDEPTSIPSPTLTRQPSTPLSRPAFGRVRAQSVVRRIVVSSNDVGTVLASPVQEKESPKPASIADSRKASIRKEVMIPAWQFFRILPWYTADMPSNDAQVAAHFSTNPIIGICLKRYGCTNQGVPYRSKTIVDIPLEIALPYFIQDDRAEQDTSLFRDFKMVLQAIVCHRGESTNAGHYVSVVRALASNNKMGKSETSPPQQPGKEGPPGYRDDAWFILDDLANIRVKPVNIERLLQDEMPYLLFYQVQPMLNNETQPQGMPPPYQAKDTLHQRAVQSLGSSHDSSGFGESLAAHGPSLTQESSPSAGSSQVVTPNEDVPQLNGISLTLEAASPTREGQFTSDQKSDWQLLLNDTVDTSRLSISSITASPRVSFSAAHAERLRASFSETDIAQEALKPPNEKEQLGRRLSRAASKFSLNGKKRQTSRTDEARKSGTFSRFNPMKSKDSSSKEKEQVKTAENSSADASKAASLVDIAALDGVRDSKAGNGSKPLTSDEKARGEVFIIGDDDVPRKITADDLGNKNRKQHHRFRSGEKGEPSDDPGSKKVPDRECSMM